MNILGISAFYHDSAACLVRDGEIVAAAQEERFTREKHDPSFPRRAAEYCLRQGRIGLNAVDAVVFYEKPFLKFERIIETQLAYAPRSFVSFLAAVPVWLKEKLWMSEIMKKELPGFSGELLFCQHHEAHAASAFYPSPFREAAFLTADGAGEWATTTWGEGADDRLEIRSELRFPHSLGLLYSAFTYYTGFKVNSAEYKVMGLAPYGRPAYEKLIYDHLIDLKDDGSFKLNPEYFNYCGGLTMTGERFHRLFGGPPRAPEAELTRRDMDLAASVQAVTEEVMLRTARHVRRETGQRYLCLAGGVALNCVANGKLLRENVFDDLWVQPAAGDAGGALGAALFGWHQVYGRPRAASGEHDSMQGCYLGPSFDNDEIEGFLQERGAPFEHVPYVDLPSRVAELLEWGKVVGWFQGRMEYGPRALGNRSILGDPRLPEMQSRMNLKIKFRESFRPFAPAVLSGRASEYFDIDRESPYMLLTAEVRQEKRVPLSDTEARLEGLDKLRAARSVVPAVTHVDYSARLQTVRKERAPLFYALIELFSERTGCPVIINTSFNVRGEPIVCTPRDAYRCFMRTDMDCLVLGNAIIRKEDQPVWRGPDGPKPGGGTRAGGLVEDVRGEVARLDTGAPALRNFGLLLAAVCGAAAAILFLQGHASWRGWTLGGAVLAAAGTLFPRLLRLPYRLWMLAGSLLGWLMTRMILALVYLCVVTPVALLLRMLGKDILDERLQRGGGSYWRRHEPASDRYRKQF